MKVFVVTEGQTDAQFFQLLLSHRVETAFTVVPAGGKSATISLAQSLLISRHEPVALIIDADSVFVEGVREQERLYHDMLLSRSMQTPFLLLLAVPEMEYLFFESQEVLSAVGMKPSDRQAIDAKYQPKQVLDQLLRKKDWTRAEFFGHLPASAMDELATLPFLSNLIGFVKRPQGFQSWSNAPHQVLSD
jgi:hypothetical protein